MHFLKIAQYFILNVTMAVAVQIPVSLHVMHLNLCRQHNDSKLTQI